MKPKIITFILTLGVWIILAGGITRDILLIGAIVSLFITIIFSTMLFRKTNSELTWFNIIKSIYYMLLFIPVFFYEALIAALKVSRHVFERKPSFSPGIVKVKTKLTNVSAITILANLITLTPGTLTLDFDKSERAFYIHWIDVKTRKEAEASKAIIQRFERWLDVIFS